jgi:hypothetical protein
MTTAQDTINRAQQLADQADRERRWYKAGRRASDREVALLREQLALASSLLGSAVHMVERKHSTEQELNALKMGVEMLQGQQGGTA